MATATNKGTKKVTKKVIERLVDGLKECWPDFDITINDFVNPTLDSVIKFYERLLHEFGININAIMKILSQNWKELEDIMYVNVLCTCANRIYHMLNLTSNPFFAPLCLSSFLNPGEDEYLVTRISLIANYLYYAEGRTANTIIPLKNKVLEEVTALETINIKANKLTEHLKTASKTLSENAETLENVKKNTKCLQFYIRAGKKNLDELDVHIQKLDAKLKCLQQESDTLTKSRKNYLKKRIELHSFIVNDYETYNSARTNHRNGKKIKEKQANSSECGINLESKTKTLKSLEKNYEIIHALNSYLDEVLETFNVLDQNSP